MDPVGVFLARSAALERAAISAFKQLAREMEHHGAPAELVTRLRRAARQEVTHARLLRDAAAQRGCTVPRMHASKAPVAPRPLLDLALENAVEGCGREMLGAALLQLQSEIARDLGLRPIFARIARDETEHAALAWDLQAWLESRLSAPELNHVRAEREAFLERCNDRGAHMAPAVEAMLGWPSVSAWQTLVASVRSGCAALAA
jgi:hypothetical protein